MSCSDCFDQLRYFSSSFLSFPLPTDWSDAAVFIFLFVSSRSTNDLSRAASLKEAGSAASLLSIDTAADDADVVKFEPVSFAVYQKALRKYEELREEHDDLRRLHSDLISAHSEAAGKLELVQVRFFFFLFFSRYVLTLHLIFLTFSSFLVLFFVPPTRLQPRCSSCSPSCVTPSSKCILVLYCTFRCRKSVAS